MAQPQMMITTGVRQLPPPLEVARSSLAVVTMAVSLPLAAAIFDQMRQRHPINAFA
jgi:hypothetical protein